MTSALPYTTRYRAHQAWRGGYGEYIDEAEVILNDSGLTFIFSARNMRLQSEIGVHWTMKCGNDVVEGAASVPAIAMTPVAADPAYAELSPLEPADAMAVDAVPPDRFPAAVTGAPVPEAFAGGTTSGSAVPFASAFGAALLPFAVNSSDDDAGSGGGSNGGGGAVTPFFYEPPVSVPEPSIVMLLIASLFGLASRKRIIKLLN